MNAIETFKHAGRTIQIFVDEDPVNPCKDYDQYTTIACWHRRAKLGNRQISGGITAENLNSQLVGEGEKVLAMLPVYLYEHGGMTMRTGAFFDPFDSGQVGWAYVTEKSADKMGCTAKRTTTQFYEAMICEDVKTYDLYLTGQCYGYVVKGIDGDELDSGCGFLGDLEYVRLEARCAAENSEDPAIAREADALAVRATFAGVLP